VRNAADAAALEQTGVDGLAGAWVDAQREGAVA